MSAEPILTTTTPSVEGRKISEYLGVVINFDIGALVPGYDLFKNLEKESKERGANAIVGIRIGEFQGDGESGFYIYGTAVRLEDE